MPRGQRLRLELRAEDEATLRTWAAARKAELVAQIMTCIRISAERAKPFRWTYTGRPLAACCRHFRDATLAPLSVESFPRRGVSQRASPT